MATWKRSGIPPGTKIEIGAVTRGPKGEMEDWESLSELLLGGNGFKREGDTWFIAFGQRAFPLRHTKGLEYIRYLIERRGQPVSASELVEAAQAGQQEGECAADTERQQAALRELGVSKAALDDAGPASDLQALRALNVRVNHLNAEIAEAEANHDAAEVQRLTSEKEEIRRQINADFDRFGRPRRARAKRNQDRNSVAKCINESIEQIRAVHPDLAAHFDQAIKTGFDCVYSPQEDPGWWFDW